MLSQLRPVDWDKSKGLEAAAEFHRHSDPFSLSWEEIRIHVALMLERLTFQRDHFKAKGPSPRKMVEDSLALGPEFTSRWASRWKQGRFDWAGTERVDVDLEDRESMPFEDYDSTYSPFFFIFWKEEPADFENMFRGKPNCDQEVLDSIRSIVADMSEKLIPDGDFTVPTDVIWNPSSSNGFDGGEVVAQEWSLEFENPDGDHITDRLVFSRGYAMKRPSESRDIGVLTPASLRLHRDIMYPLQRACRRIPGCVYGRDIDFIKATVTMIGESCRHFYMRDYTKSGMTIPHPVIRAVFEGFYQRQPGLAERACRAFELQQVHFKQADGSWICRHPDTGAPLGMFVEGYTLLGYAIHTLISEGRKLKTKFNATNDDMIVGSLNRGDIEEYTRLDVHYQHALGMLVKVSKTGISTDRFFYCEEYWDGDKLLPKGSLAALAILGSKFAINIVHAKELVSSILTSYPAWVPQIKRAVTYVQESFIPEFSEQEYYWPILFGGWWPTYKDGLDASILWREEHADFIADAAYWACRTRIRDPVKLKSSPTLAYGRLKKLTLLELPENKSDWLSLVPLFGNKKTLQSYYSLLSRSPRDLVKKYKETYIRRQSLFTRIINGKAEVPSVHFEYLKRHPNSIILKGMEGMEYTKEGFLISNPLLGSNLTSTDLWLEGMRAAGYIDIGGIATKFSDSEKRMHKLGLTKQLEYTYLPIAKGGCSRYLLNQHIKGVQDFYDRTGLFIKRFFPEDETLEDTQWWEWLPDLPFQWILRVKKYSGMSTTPPLTPDTAPWWHDACLKMYTPPPDWHVAEEVIEPSSDDLKWELEFREILSGLITDVDLEVKATFKRLHVPIEGMAEHSTYEVRSSDGLDTMHFYSEGSARLPEGETEYSMWDDPDAEFEEPEWMQG
jgi:hypothetical protein